MAHLHPIYVVILNFNHWQMTSGCVDCVLAQGIDPGHIVIVDNDSVNDSVVQLKTQHPKTTILEMKRNLGYAGGANAGIRYALAREAGAVWLLNNDVSFPKNSLGPMVERLGEAGTGIVGAVVHPADDVGVIEAWGGGTVNPWLGTTARAQRPQRLDYIAGTCMLLSAGMLGQVGLFDESYFFYLEDVDLCLRANSAGWALAVAEEAHIEHMGGASSGGGGPRPVWIDGHHARGSGILLGKHLGRRLAVALPLRIVGMIVVRARRFQIARIPRIVACLVAGVLEGRRSKRTSV